MQGVLALALGLPVAALAVLLLLVDVVSFVAAEERWPIVFFGIWSCGVVIFSLQGFLHSHHACSSHVNVDRKRCVGLPKRKTFLMCSPIFRPSLTTTSRGANRLA